MLPSPTISNITALAAADYQTGTLENFYVPTNGTNLSKLLNAGSQTADLSGLFWFTTTTNNFRETNSMVDIGYHAAATLNGVPLDSGDGIFDLFQDANGNGVLDSGETDWTNLNDWGLRVLITRPRNGSILP